VKSFSDGAVAHKRRCIRSTQKRIFPRRHSWV